MNPFAELPSDEHLTALLRAWGAPQLDSRAARPYLDDLVKSKHLKNISKHSTPWWKLTSKGNLVKKAFFDASFNEHRDEKEAFLRRTHGLFR